MSTSTEPTATSTAPITAPGATTSPTSPISPSTTPSNPIPTATSTQSDKLIAVACYALDPSSKSYRIRPAVASSLSPLAILVATPSTASSSTQPGVVACFNAATDLVHHLDEQLARPPNMGETLSGLFRPASAELGGRLKKLGEKVKSGKEKVPVGKGGEEWSGDRRVEAIEWKEFEKIFGTE
ncbi:uncharacterized protein MKK02DRAFT_40288 [Dioszegia hungarica]|uniref:Uncharacterized protein n=1 Tax=Dioszegia hungarica TaxID=4972 RepID=A0AA38H2V0_9TREE|nr:uncharacterized protein MKK02DRAFT_40288 [Dioszegia hungarica]KAI9632915.1 hypothetical protein MKK02DRAFT_40288 [Dioszegia hungarica]